MLLIVDYSGAMEQEIIENKIVMACSSNLAEIEIALVTMRCK
jgi:hypothetical protein